MKRFKTQKGITLIALIITIVVLLILAVVAIGSAQESNIVGYAQNAAGGYNTSKGEEENTITDAENLLDKYASENQKESFYNVAYSKEEYGLKFYFLENNMAFQAVEGGLAAIKYTINENEISFGGISGAVFSEDWSTLTINESLILTSDVNDTYEYNPIYDQTNNIYLNGLYSVEQSDLILYITEEYFYDGSGSGYPTSSLLSNSEISESGKKVTYKDKVYTLVEEI